MHLQYLRSRSRHLWPAAKRYARSLSLCIRSPRLLPQLLLSSFLCFARWQVFAAVALPAATRFGLFAGLVAGVGEVTCCVVYHVAFQHLLVCHCIQSLEQLIHQDFCPLFLPMSLAVWPILSVKTYYLLLENIAWQFFGIVRWFLSFCYHNFIKVDIVIRAAFVTARKFLQFKERLPAKVDRSFLIIYAALSAELRRFRLAETWQRLNRTDTIKVSVVFSPHMHRTFFGTSPRPCLSGVSPARVAAVRQLLLLLYLLMPARPTASGGQECWLLLKRKHLGKPLLATD